MRKYLFKEPQIIGEVGNKQFVLYDGQISKPFFTNAEFDSRIGSYPILNENNEIVEYMDLIGNFTNKPTKFAKEFSSYIDSRRLGVSDAYAGSIFFCTGLIDFPSKYLVDKKIRKIVKAEENYKFKTACMENNLVYLLTKLKCKLYLIDIYNQKIARAERLLKQMQIKGKNIQDIYEQEI